MTAPALRFAPITERLKGLGGEKWRLYRAALEKQKRGEEVLNLTIGEPDFPTPPVLVETVTKAIRAGRTLYSTGRGEMRLLEALAARNTARLGRPFTPDRFISTPGAQGANFVALSALAGPGDEVLLANPMYATYEGQIRATGAEAVPVALSPEHGFRLQAADVARAITPRSRVIFINTPHNPTGAVLRPAEITALLELAEAENLWVLSDEVYTDITHDGIAAPSALADPRFEHRVVTAGSISKTHSAPGFRAGWLCGPANFTEAAVSVAESAFFGTPPFIADMTAEAVLAEPVEARAMAARMAARAHILEARLEGVAGMHLHRPEAGMFALLDIRALSHDSQGFAFALLEATGVALMPGVSFGSVLEGWLRIALNAEDALTAEAGERIARFARSYRG